MTLNQISVFVENQPGKLQQLTDVLAKNNINMRALSLAEASEFGIARIIADSPQAASDLLTKEGFIHTVTKVLGVIIPDTPGGLNQVLHILSENNINVEYMYAFLSQKDTARACMIFHVQDTDAAVNVLAANRIACLSPEAPAL
ncbi:MAG: ACT domain-containing protein [Clostridia bacterium]|nr:ACT domain-containing protein [Clostridia bacterium]